MTLLKLLRSDEKSRKIFGKRELKIIEKQLMGVNLTQSEKNRLSRDIRKKLEFIQDATRFSGEFKLKKGAEIKKLISESKEAILADALSRKMKRIFLYGSTVENKRALMSDVDIAVEFSDISLKEATLFVKRLSGQLNSRVDLQVYNFLKDDIKKDISARGVVVYGYK